MIYTTVLHDVRVHFGISCNDYCVADSILKLMANPKSKFPGWCTIGNGELGEKLGFSRQTVIKIVADLVKRNLVIENDRKHKQVTPLFYDAVMKVKAGKPIEGVKTVDSIENDKPEKPGVSRLFTPVKTLYTHEKVGVKVLYSQGVMSLDTSGVKSLDTIIIYNNNRLNLL